MIDCGWRTRRRTASLRLFGEPIGQQPPVRRSIKTHKSSYFRMSKLPIDNASIKIKRKRAPVWPFASRDLCEQVVKLLMEDDLVRELSPPDEWRIHPSIEARGKGFQHERRLWVTNDLNAWHIAKLR